MSDRYRWVYPKIGRAGLGNELFPLLRAVDEADSRDIPLLPPRWGQLRIGPTLRGERDRRQYWKLFKAPSPALRLARAALTTRTDSRVLVVSGMDGLFEPLMHPGHWYRTRLAAMARPGTIAEESGFEYVSAHVRLGDFARAEESAREVSANNTSTPISWYVNMITMLRSERPGTRVVVSSDGSDAELRPLLALPNVQRSNARNALDELFILARSSGIVGSRSTFTAWGAFLGDAPLLVAPGGNAYRPTERAWEADSVEDARRWLEALPALSRRGLAD